MIGLRAPENFTRVKYPNGTNPDIITTLVGNAARAANQITPATVDYFKGATVKDTANNIWRFLRSSITYQRDPLGKQLIRLPARFISDREGDCKSYSLFTYAVLRATYPDLPLMFRFASYSKSDLTPTHVYTVLVDHGREIIVDGVYAEFNAEAPYQHKTNYKMQIAVLSGVPARRVTPLSYNAALIMLQSKLKPGGPLYVILENEMDRVKGKGSGLTYPPAQLKRYAHSLEKRIAATSNTGLLAQVLQKELAAVRSGRFAGRIAFITSDAQIQGLQDEVGRLSLKKIGKGLKHTLKKINPLKAFKGVKAVAFLVPRKAFMALVALNVRGLATRLARTPKKDVAALWDKLGGNPGNLFHTISIGVRQKPLLGAKKSIRTVSGIGYVLADSDSIGLAPAASTAAILVAAAPVLVAFISLFHKKGVPPVPGMGSDDALATDSGNILSKIESFGEAAYQMAKDTGIIPERPLSPEEEAVNHALPDPEDKQGFNVKKMLLPLAALTGLYILAKK